MKRSLHVAFALALAATLGTAWPLLGTGAASSGAAPQPQPKRPGLARTAVEPRVDKLIVKLREPRAGSQSLAEDAERVRGLGKRAGQSLTPVRPVAGGAQVLRLERALPLAEARAVAARIAQDPAVEYAEPNVRFRVLRVPNEPRFAEWQWNYFVPTSLYSGAVGTSTITTTAVGGANLPPAWDVTVGDTAVIVAVIDTGIANHPDLNGVGSGATYLPAGRWLPGYDFVSLDNGATLPPGFVANDGNGRDADPSDPGDWITAEEKRLYPDDCAIGETPPYQPSDSSWHGTHMAGLAAATANNGIGIAGAAWNVQVLPVRALGKCGGDLSDIADAIRWSAGLPVAGAPPNPLAAKVISLSLGGGDTCSATMQAAVDAANASGAVVVAATGNEAQVGLISPANCRGVIAVTAHTINGENAEYANIGAGTSVSAPGGGSPESLGAGGVTDNPAWDGYFVYSSVLFGATGPLSSDGSGQRGAAYAGFVGTSVATPQAAGVAALLKSVQPTAPAEFVRAWLTMADRARPHPANGSCRTLVRECGSGLLDAQLAVQGARDAVPAVSVTAAARSASPNGSISFAGTARAWPGRTLQSAIWSTTAGTLSATTGANVTLTLPSGGSAEVSLTGTDSTGAVARDAVVVRVNRTPVIDPLGAQTAAVGQVLTFRVSATDGDGDAVLFDATSASTVPAGTLASNGTFTWNTAGAAPGTYQLVVTATDGISTSAPVSVTITLAPGGSSAVPPVGGGGGGGGALPSALLLLLLLAHARRLRDRV